VKSTWKQCVWKKDDGKDTGMIQVLISLHLGRNVVHFPVRNTN
jgi:hypothetical protein